MNPRFGIAFWSIFAGGVAFAVLSWMVPAEGPIREGLAEFEKLTQSTHQQLEILHKQVQSLPRKNLPPAMESAQQYVTDLQGRIKLNSEVAVAVRDTSRALATQVRLLKSEESRQVIESLHSGLNATAGIIESRVCAAAEEAAELFDQLAFDLSGDLERLASLLEKSPVELDKPIAQVIDGLAQAQAILGVANQALDPEAFNNMGKLCENVSKALLETSQFPFIGVVTDQNALKEASSNLNSVKKKIEQLEKSIPQVKQSANEASTKLRVLQEELAKLHDTRQSLDAFIKAASTNLTNAARTAPAILREISSALREISLLRSVTPALRAMASTLDQVDGQWVKLVATLDTTAELLEHSASAADLLASNPEAIEQQTQLLMSGTEATVEFLNYSVSSLDQLQENLLRDAHSVGRISKLLPGYGDSISRMLQASRWCLGIASMACFVLAFVRIYSDTRL